MSDLTAALRQVVAAKHPEDLFDVDKAASADEQAEQLKSSFRHYVRVVHPDVNGNAAGAAAAFMKLERLYAQAQAALGTGVYGERAPAPQVIRGAHGRYVVGARTGASDTAEFFELRAGTKTLQLKVARLPADNDLIEREVNALALLRSDTAAEARLQPYVPEMVDSFSMASDAGTVAASAFAGLPGFVSLHDVRQAFPDGIHWRDMAWMFRRILVAAGFAHRNGLVHGAILPERVMIHPTEHGLVLTDWSYHAAIGESLIAVPRRYRRWYPDEALKKAPAGPELDVLLAVRCAQYLLGMDAPHWMPRDTTPAKLRAFLAGCATASPQSRPTDAWELLEEFDDLIGPREFRPFQMPSPETETPSSGGPSAATTTERG